MRRSLLLIALLLCGCSAASSEPPPQTVTKVDLNRYMGRWHEIAMIPMFFQRKCVGNTTAEYNLLESGQVSVLNSCDTAEGKRIQADGVAKSLNPPKNTRLKVTFLKLLGDWRWFAGGDYWVIDLDEQDYSYAVVGHPKRKYGWILSRTPVLPAPTLQGIGERLKAQGYDLCRFNITPQAGGFSKTQPLCEMVEGAKPQP